MKGIIFNLLEEVVTSAHGAIAWADLVDAADVGGAYTSLGSYPDAELLALVDTGAAALGLTAAQVLRWFGRSAMPLLSVRFAHLFAPHANARAFVSSVNAIIHPEVRVLYTGAACPHFHFTDRADGTVMIGYQSPRRLSPLVEGFVEGASDHFGEIVMIEHVACMHSGAPLCRIVVRWPH
ncbi:heme NO-binding domain-containing protein [Novosphingobium sp.]|uniref:heme NO-binding domain-containing protein n=1 Tax=Novosphingobium sp. TaxID=1874826 RepID=UPI003B522747